MGFQKKIIKRSERARLNCLSLEKAIVDDRLGRRRLSATTAGLSSGAGGVRSEPNITFSQTQTRYQTPNLQDEQQFVQNFPIHSSPNHSRQNARKEFSEIKPNLNVSRARPQSTCVTKKVPRNELKVLSRK